jgi:sigma-B regulation protein RsbU (phosphoserine phosphatase)
MALLLTGALLSFLAAYYLLQRARRRIERLEEEKRVLRQEKQLVVDFMQRMAEALADNPSREHLLERIVHAAILCTGALSACIFERTADRQMRGVAVEGLFPPHRPLSDAVKGKLTTRAKFIEQILRSETFPVGEGIAGEVAATGRAALVADAANDPRVVKHEDPALAVRSLIAAPLVFRDRFFGVLAVANPTNGRSFTATDFELMKSLAEQAALALHNAEFLHLQIERRQLDLDLSLASGIQQMLLPKAVPQMAGLEIDARYLPAQKVGGDLYDLIPLSDGTLGLAVADVSGKGIPASLLMAICRSNLRQIAPRFTSPAQVLVELNGALVGDIHPDMFITLIYAVVDTRAGTITFARAGHELPLLGHGEAAGGGYATEFLGSEGMPVGLVPNEIFAGAIVDRVVSFQTGDTLVLYTDGITEAPNEEAKEFSGARLADTVRVLHNRSARELDDGILETLGRFVGGTPQRDDYTLVTVKRVAG